MNSILKKSLSFIMVFCMMFVAFAFTVQAADTVAESVDFTTKAASHNVYTDTWKYDDWTVSGGANNSKGWAYIKLGGKKTNLESYNKIYVASPVVSSPASKVTINFIAGSLGKSGMAVNSWGLYVYSDSAMTTQIDYVAGVNSEITKNASLYTFTPSNGTSWPTNAYYKVNFDLKNTTTTNGIIWLDNISIYAADETTVTEPNLTIASNASETVIGQTINFNATLTNLDGVDVEWVSSNKEVATVVDGTLTGLSIGTTTIKAVAGDVESNEIEVKVYPVANSTITIAEALQVCELTGNTKTTSKYTVVGTVKSIDEEYNSQYNNITVVVTDGAKDITAYRMQGGENLTIGTEIAVSGNLVNYLGTTPEFATGCTYVAYANVVYMDGEEVYYSYETTVGSELVVPTEPTKEGFNFLGWYDENELEHDYTLPVPGNLTLYAKWVSNQVDVFTVTFDVNGGNGEYDAQEVIDGEYVVAVENPTRQYATFLGWSADGVNVWDFENDVVTEDITLTALWDVLADSVVEFVESETKASLNFGYTVSGEEVATIAEEETATLKYTGASTTNMGTSNNAATVGLDSTLFTVTADKGGNSNNVGLNKAGNIRLYYGSESNGNVMTVAIKGDYVIKSISIKLATKNEAVARITAGEATDSYQDFTCTADFSADINASQFSIKNVTSSNIQIQITSIEITYGTDAPAVTYTFNDVAMRFQGALDAATYEDLLAQGAEVKFGVAAAKVAKLNGQTLFEAIDAEDANAKFIECQPALTQEGDTYLFALLLTNIPVEGFADEVVAAAYVEVDGVKHYMSVKQFSVNSLAQYYVNNLAEDTAVAAHIEALKALAKAN